jgi:hypothetical protein
MLTTLNLSDGNANSAAATQDSDTETKVLIKTTEGDITLRLFIICKIYCVLCCFLITLLKIDVF